jgi:preprotein translocase subunit SecB
MHPSNLQLKRYFLTRFDFSANPEYDPAADLELAFEDLVVSSEKAPLNGDVRRDWEVTLALQYSAAKGKNIPYLLSAEIVGIFSVCDKVDDEAVEFYVDTNATSVLYSTLREIVITMTAKGPFHPLLLPTVSFYEPVDEETEDEE